MRIALIAHTNAPWTPHYARFFKAQGHVVCIASFHPQLIEGIEARCFAAIPFREGVGKVLILRRATTIRAYFKEWAPDVIFAPYLLSNGLAAAVVGVAPLVVSARGGDVLPQVGGTPMPALVRKAIVRFVCSRSKLIHSVSKELVDALVAMGVDHEKIECFPIGVDLERFPLRQSLPSGVREHLLICTRRHEPVYRNEDIVQALSLLNRHDWTVRCLFVGGGSLLEERRRHVSRLGLDDRIAFIDQVAHDRIPSLLRRASLYISASSSDGASSSLLEAMASGVFPLVSRIRANEDWIRHGETGLTFELGNAADLANSIKRALDDSVLRNRAAVANRRTVEERGDLAVNNRRLLALLMMAIGKGTG